MSGRINGVFDCLIYGAFSNFDCFNLFVFKKRNFTPVVSAYKKAPWNFIPLVLSMFVLVETLRQSGIILDLSQLLSKRKCYF